MSRTIVFATGNRNKVRELKALAEPFFTLITLVETGVIADYEETGTTFEANSRGKAQYYSEKLSLPVVADDSGLEVDALNGEPGIFSARYLDPEMPYMDRCTAILDKLAGMPEERRRARFCCVASCARNGSVIASEYGIVEGRIAAEAKGQGGFGYDPIFFYPPFRRTFAQVSLAEKNTVSHRFRAFQALFRILQQKLNNTT